MYVQLYSVIQYYDDAVMTLSPKFKELTPLSQLCIARRVWPLLPCRSPVMIFCTTHRALWPVGTLATESEIISIAVTLSTVIFPWTILINPSIICTFVWKFYCIVVTQWLHLPEHVRNMQLLWLSICCIYFQAYYKKCLKDLVLLGGSQQAWNWIGVCFSFFLTSAVAALLVSPSLAAAEPCPWLVPPVPLPPCVTRHSCDWQRCQHKECYTIASLSKRGAAMSE